MIPEIAIWRAANLLINRHGEGAVMEATRLAGRMRDRGDSDGMSRDGRGSGSRSRRYGLLGGASRTEVSGDHTFTAPSSNFASRLTKAMNSNVRSGSSLISLWARGLRSPATAPENIIIKPCCSS